MNKEIVEITSPKSLMNFSKKLKDFIVSQNLYVNIQGRNYVEVEGWQFAGGNMGLFPVVESCEKLDRENEIAYKASVAIYSGEKIISRGIAVCSTKEKGKENKDEFVIASMAQTRAEGKAYRLIIGWLMKFAGYEGTPAEDMEIVSNSVVEKEVSQTEIEKTKAKLDKAMTKEELSKVWKSLPKEAKGNKEVIKYAKEIQDFINNENNK